MTLVCTYCGKKVAVNIAATRTETSSIEECSACGHRGPLAALDDGGLLMLLGHPTVASLVDAIDNHVEAFEVNMLELRRPDPPGSSLDVLLMVTYPGGGIGSDVNYPITRNEFWELVDHVDHLAGQMSEASDISSEVTEQAHEAAQSAADAGVIAAAAEAAPHSVRARSALQKAAEDASKSAVTANKAAERAEELYEEFSAADLYDNSLLARNAADEAAEPARVARDLAQIDGELPGQSG